MLPTVRDWSDIIRDAPPAIDVRAPAEFAHGALPNAVNLPLLDDGQRAAVGTVYRRQGRDAAIRKGHALVADALRQARVKAWIDFAERHPNALLYCARGGLRSELAQRWLADAGATTVRVAGGFKALRRCALTAIDAAATRPILLLGGRTGSGKTKVLARLAAAIDLEALARHRGSAFGGLAEPQPTPVNFEGALAAALLRHRHVGPVVLEDEARTIGRLAIPAALFDAMQQAPIVLLEVPTEERVENIYEEYVCRAAAPAAMLLTALGRIERRLGGERYRRIAELMREAFAAASGPAAAEAHRRWIRRLLADYYDPMYDYQLQAKERRIVMRGEPQAVLAYLAAAAAGGITKPSGASDA